MTAQEVTDLIHSKLLPEHKSKVVEVDLPEKGESVVAVELSYGLFLDEANAIAEAFGDREMLISDTYDEDESITIYFRPDERFWNKEGGQQ